MDGSGGRGDEEGGFDERRCTKFFERKKIRQEIKNIWPPAWNPQDQNWYYDDDKKK